MRNAIRAAAPLVMFMTWAVAMAVAIPAIVCLLAAQALLDGVGYALDRIR